MAVLDLRRALAPHLHRAAAAAAADPHADEHAGEAVEARFQKLKIYGMQPHPFGQGLVVCGTNVGVVIVSPSGLAARCPANIVAHHDWPDGMSLQVRE